MKAFVKTFVFIALLLNGACSLIESKKTARQSRRSETFQVKVDWVSNTFVGDNFRFRKLNSMQPLIVGDLVIASNVSDGVSAYRRDSGQRVWFLPIRGGVDGGFAAIKDHLFFGANDGNFYAVSIAQGKVLWSFETKTENLSVPLVADGVVYFYTGTNVVYALDALTGQQLWLYSRVDNSAFSIRGASRPTLYKDGLYIGFSDGTLVVLNPKTGNLKWEKLLNKNKKFRDLDSNAVFDGDYLYITGYDSKIFCLKAESGDTVWQLDPGGYGSVAIDGDLLFYSSSKGQVLALNKKTGNQVWSYKIKEGISSEPQVTKDYVIVGEATASSFGRQSGGGLRFLRKTTGESVGFYDPGTSVFSHVSVDKNKAYMVSAEGNLYQLHFGVVDESREISWMR